MAFQSKEFIKKLFLSKKKKGKKSFLFTSELIHLTFKVRSSVKCVPTNVPVSTESDGRSCHLHVKVFQKGVLCQLEIAGLFI